MVFSVFFFDKMQIDDPVGAISVHGVVGAWGVLSIGLFAKNPDAFVEGRLGDDYEASGLFYGGGINQLVIQAVMLVIIVAWVVDHRRAPCSTASRRRSVFGSAPKRKSKAST